MTTPGEGIQRLDGLAEAPLNYLILTRDLDGGYISGSRTVLEDIGNLMEAYSKAGHSES